MNILHLATKDKGSGGGGFDAAYRLHINMRTAGVNSAMLVLHKNSDDPNVIEMIQRINLWGKIRLFVNRQLLRIYRRLLTSPYFIIELGSLFSVSAFAKALPFKPDAIIVHWVSTYITPALMEQLSKITGAPLYWYMMDMAPITGGCHYAFDCTEYERSCGRCPQLKFGRSRFDISYIQWRRKWLKLSEANITAIAATTWLKRQVAQSSVFANHPVELVMLGIDVSVFQPVTQESARLLLKLPVDKKVIFFGAHMLHEERKGLTYFLRALNVLYQLLESNAALRDSVLVVTAGEASDTDRFEIPFEYRHVGLLQGDKMLASAYQASDIFVNASLEDSGPMMVNESILCGTPVVSFEMGVALDLVQTGTTGYRAKLMDFEDLARGMLQLLSMSTGDVKIMRSHCRSVGLEHCHPEVQVRSFVEICSRQSLKPGRVSEALQ